MGGGREGQFPGNPRALMIFEGAAKANEGRGLREWLKMMSARAFDAKRDKQQKLWGKAGQDLVTRDVWLGDGLPVDVGCAQDRSSCERDIDLGDLIVADGGDFGQLGGGQIALGDQHIG